MVQAETEERRERREAVIQESFLLGAQTGCIGVACGIAAVATAHAFIPRFRILNVGAKTALAISPGVVAFVLKTETKMLEARTQGREPKA